MLDSLRHNPSNPTVWSTVESAPAGVSVHYMTSDVDAGPIIDRRKVTVRPDDDGRDIYERLEENQIGQFVDVWPGIRGESANTIDQGDEKGTYHYKSDFVDLWEVDLEETVRAGDLVDRLRALTFDPYENYFERDGRKFWLVLSITAEDESDFDERRAKNVPRYVEDDP